MDKSDPRLIVTLVASNLVAENAWNRPENCDRCKPAPEFEDEDVDLPSRQTTPAVSRQSGSRLQLTFENKPKDLERGFVFGRDPRKCDILLGGKGAEFSRQHFRITFNDEGEVILEDTSRTKTSVHYDGETPPGRNQFTWILFHKYKHIVVTVANGELIFKVEWPDHDYCRVKYEECRDIYLEERRTALPALGKLGVESQQTTALLTAHHSPKQRPIYLLGKRLGQGVFGTVYKAVNVSTGDECAVKMFNQDNWRNEVEILKSVTHEHIVEFRDFSNEQKPLLVMEYLRLGNLACQDLITEEQNVTILHQGLQALEYLHSRSPPLVHRDIKPENILVQSRIPFVIKLVDFGFAKHGSTLTSFKGSWGYAAPEVFESRHYNAMVDIWSLGVVVLEYGYHVPRSTGNDVGVLWCQYLVDFAKENEKEGDTLMALILTKMLRMNYHDRQSASECLKEVYRRGFHQVQTVQTGGTTPAGKTTGQYGFTKIKFVTAQLHQNDSSYSDVSSRIHDEGGISGTTEVAPSKRGLREAIHLYNIASPRALGRHPQAPPQIGNPQTGDSPSTTPSKRPWSKTPQGSRNDAVGKRQSKRLRALVSRESDEDHFKASNLKSYPEQLSSNHAGPLATNVKGLTRALKPTLQRVDYSRPIENVSDYHTKQLPRFFVTNVLPQPITVRRSDYGIRLRDICRASNRPRQQNMAKIKREFSRRYDTVHDFKYKGTYVDFWVGVELCRRYGLTTLEKELRTWEGIPQEPVEVQPELSEPVKPEQTEEPEQAEEPELENRLCSLKRTSDGPFLKAPLSDDWLQESETVSVRNKRTPVCEIDSASDVAGSLPNVTSREPFSTQRSYQPGPPIHHGKDTASPYPSECNRRRS